VDIWGEPSVLLVNGSGHDTVSFGHDVNRTGSVVVVPAPHWFFRFMYDRERGLGTGTRRSG
jgi:hypothetical protein